MHVATLSRSNSVPFTEIRLRLKYESLFCSDDLTNIPTLYVRTFLNYSVQPIIFCALVWLFPLAIVRINFKTLKAWKLTWNSLFFFPVRIFADLSYALDKWYVTTPRITENSYVLLRSVQYIIVLCWGTQTPSGICRRPELMTVNQKQKVHYVHIQMSCSLNGLIYSCIWPR